MLMMTVYLGKGDLAAHMFISTQRNGWKILLVLKTDAMAAAYKYF